MEKIKQRATGIFAPVLIMLFTAMLALSCKKENPGIEPEPVKQSRAAGMVPYYELQRVENLAAETDDLNPTASKKEILFSLDYKKEQPAEYAKTTSWDISFSGLYNSFLGGNNNEDKSNSGYQGPGKGGIAVVPLAFEEVSEIPAASAFKTAKGLVGTDDSGSLGEGMGWYLYDFGGTIVSDGSFEKQHVAYAMGNTFNLANGQKSSPRTVIIRTATGDFAKIKMISCYKDIFTTDKMLRSSPKMFFTFEYVIVPAGSTKFEIK